MQLPSRLVDTIQIAVLDDRDQARSRQLADALDLPLVDAEAVAAKSVAADMLLGFAGSRLEVRWLRPPRRRPVWVDFLGAEMARRRRGGRGAHPLARAMGRKQPLPTIVDATAGLGRDAFVLAGLGYEVVAVERSPILHALLRNGLERAMQETGAAMQLDLVAGRIDGINLHVLSNDTLQYIFSLPNLSEHTDLSCAIARFDIESGIARSEALLIATPQMTISGKGFIDLGAEKLEFAIAADRNAFVPVGFKKPVRIHGTLSDPKVSTTTADTGMIQDLFGKFLGYVAAPFVFAPLSATGSLIDILREPGTKSPCLAR